MTDSNVRQYDLFIIFRANIEGGAFDAAIEKVREVLQKHGGDVEDVRPLGKQRLAYPILKGSEGSCASLTVNVPTTAIPDIHREFRFDDNIVREMLTTLNSDATTMHLAEEMQSVQPAAGLKEDDKHAESE